METSNIVSVLVFLAFVVIPIWWLVQSGNKKKKELSKRFDNIKNQYQLNCTESDSWDNIVIGFDNSAGKLLWFKDVNGSDEYVLIDTGKYAQCKKVNLSRNVNVGKENSLVVDKLGLELVPNTSNEQPVLLEFYNSNNSYLYSLQFELLGKWQKTIARSLSMVVA